MIEDRELIRKMAKVASDYKYETVLGAAGNIMLNVLRQKHKTADAAEEEFDALVAAMKKAIRADHYRQDGTRKGFPMELPFLQG